MAHNKVQSTKIQQALSAVRSCEMACKNKEVFRYYENYIKQKRNKSRDVVEDGYFHSSKCPDFSPEQD
jgi:hypothetical protein